MKKRATLTTFISGIVITMIACMFDAFKDLMKDSLPSLLDPLINVIAWTYSFLFEWKPVDTSKEFWKVLYVLTGFSGLFLMVIGLLWCSGVLLNQLRNENNKDATQPSDIHTLSPFSLEQQVSAFGEIATVLDEIETPGIDDLHASMAVEDFLTGLIDEAATCLGLKADEYRAMYFVPVNPYELAPQDLKYVRFGRKSVLTKRDWETLIKPTIMGSMETIDGMPVETWNKTFLIVDDNEPNHAKEVVIVRNRGRILKLGLAVATTRHGVLTEESKALFDRVASKLLLIGHLPQITKYVLESE